MIGQFGARRHFQLSNKPPPSSQVPASGAMGVHARPRAGSTSSSHGLGNGSPQSGSDSDDHKRLLDSSGPPMPLPEAKQPHGPGRGGWRKWGLLLALVAGSLLLWASWEGAPDLRGETFVTVEGTQFELQCRPFLVAGFNVDNVAQAPISALARKMPGFNGRRLVRQLLRQAAGAGLNVMRTFAHTTDPAYPLQVRPGQYDEDAFRALDFVVAEAGRAGLKVVLSLVDNWKYAGGVDEYVDWSANVPQRDPKFPPVNKLGDMTVEEYSPERLDYENRRKANFFKDPACREMYKAHVNKVLLRVNVYTGVAYKDDPTLLGWNLINEPRCSAYETPECPALVTAWIEEMAAHVKSLDSRHLLTVGEEGFWGAGDPLKSMNPGAALKSDWASRTGQDFAPNHASPHIDYATTHLWPDNWATHNHSFHRAWLGKHVTEAGAVLHKPLMFEEFGKVLGRGHNPPPEAIKRHRDPVFATVYDMVEGAVARGEGLVGSLYWRWGFNVYDAEEPGPYGVLPEHSTFDLVATHAKRMRQHMTSRPPRPDCQLGCWVGTTALFGLVRKCENRPGVCSEQLARHSQQAQAPEGGLQLGGTQVFATQKECCRAGLGAHAAGCTPTLI